MSSIGKASVSGEDSQAMQINYEAREARKDRNYEGEIKNLNAAHKEEVDRITTESKEEIDKLHTRDQAKFSEAEQKYLKEMENMKAMYQRKLAEKA